MNMMHSLGNRLLALVLCLALLAGMVPVLRAEAENKVGYGTVAGITPNGSVEDQDTDTGRTTVISYSGLELQFHLKDASVGRNQDGWWVGIQVTAPEGMTKEEHFVSGENEVKYQRNNGGTWTDGISFWGAQDSDKGTPDTVRYLTMWGLVNENYLKNANMNGKKLNYEWRFDWDMDGTYEQLVRLTLDPADITLMKEEQQVYPAASVGSGKVKGITSGAAISDSTADGVEHVTVTYSGLELQFHLADAAAGRNQDGWWVGIQVTAPESMTTKEDFETSNGSVTYQRNEGGVWSAGKVFWNAQDSDPNAADTARYLTMWGLLTPNYLKNALQNNKNVNYQWRFDWNNDGLYEQVVTLSVEPKDILLVKDGVQMYPALGEVSSYSGGNIEGSGSGKTTVTIDNASLVWAPADPQIGRNEAAWWVGIRVDAPAGMTKEDLMKSGYRSLGQSWSQRKDFWKMKDSADDADKHYIQMWMMLTPESISAKENLTMKYYFDWDGDGTEEQEIVFTVVTKGIQLNGIDQPDAAFKYPEPESQSADKPFHNPLLNVKGDCDITYSIKSGEEAAEIDPETGVVTFKASDVPVTVCASVSADQDGFYNAGSYTYTVTAYSVDREGFRFETPKPEKVVYAPNKSFQNLIVQEYRDGVVYSIESMTVADMVDIDPDTGVLTIKKAGTVTVQAAKAADGIHKYSETTYTLTIGKAPQAELSLSAYHLEQVWSKQPVTLPTISGGSGEGKIMMEIVKGDDVVALDDSTGTTMLKLLKAGDAVIEFWKAGDDCYEPSNRAVLQIHVEKAPQSGFGFVFVGEKTVTLTYNDNNNVFEKGAEGSLSSKPVQYVVEYEGEKAPVAVDEKTGVVTLLRVGTAVICVTSPEDDRYQAAADKYTITVLHADQEFTLEHGESHVIEYGVSEFLNTVVLAEKNSGNTLEYQIVGENKIGADIAGDGKVTFSDSDEKVGMITVRVTLPGDDCYNPCEKEYTLEVRYMDVSRLNCEVTGKRAEGNTSGWYIGGVEIHAPDGYEISYDNERSTDDWAAAVSHGEEGIANAEVFLRDPDTGAISDEIVIENIKLDTKAPDTAKIEYSNGLWETIAEKIFGFSYDTVRVTVDVEDANAHIANGSSGIAVMEYSIDGENFVTATADQIDGSKFFFDIDAQYRDMVSVRLTDVAGNRSRILQDGKTLVIDTIQPGITCEILGDYHTEGDTLLVKDEDFAITFKVEDANYDLRSAEPVIRINDVVADVAWEDHGTYGTATLSFPDDGDYVITVDFDDRVNDAEQYMMKVNVDRTAPVIDVSYKNTNVTGTDGDRKYYDAAQTAVITIVDANLNPADITVSILPETFAPAMEWQVVKTEGIMETWQAVVEFDVDDNYTMSVSCEDKLDIGAQPYGPDQFTVDTQNPAVPQIVYDKTVLNKVLESVTFGFFQSPVKVTITSTDDTAGVKYIEYSYVGKSGEYTTKTVEVKNSQNGASISFVVDESFKGTVSAKAYDYAGRCSDPRNVGTDASGAELGGIVVDSVAPIRVIAPQTEPNRIVSGSMEDVESFTEGDGTVLYYNQDVVIGFRVEEENFYPEDMVITVNDTAVAPANWTNTAENIWVGTITLKDEGDYVVRASYADKSTNKMKDYESQRIVIDRTAPVIDVVYGNTDVKNTIDGRDYFDKTQSATITVTEHNFRADEVRILVSAKDVAGKDVLKLNDDGIVEAYAVQGADRKSWTAYTAGTWRNENDTYVLELVYEADANYTFDVEYVDLATNGAADYTADLFTVDKTAPKVSIAYSSNVFQEVLNAITFGYYNANVTVTMTAVDDTTPIHRFVYSYLKASGVSGVNAQLLEQVVEEGSFSQNGNKAVATFTIPKQALGSRNQFNGTVEFTAYNRSELNTRLEDTKRLVVDNITPNATVTYNAPVQESHGVSYYDGNIDATITINEANFFARDVVVTVTKDGQTYPVDVAWTNNSYDVHTGTFTLTEDGDYTVSVQYQDKSGNQMNTYTSGILTLDTLAPVIQLSGVEMNTANKDEVYGFTITVTDTNLDVHTLNAALSAVAKGEAGLYATRQLDLGEAQEVDVGKKYTYTMYNLTEDAIYTLTCAVKDMSGNTMSDLLLDDGSVHETVRFSINREGSTFAFGDAYTEDLVNKHYVYSVDSDVVIVEVNVDPIENYAVLLNGTSLTEGQDYTTTQSSNEGEWSIRTYTISKALFEAEGEYSIVISSTDKAETTAYSDVKDLTVAFVVDQTKPVLTISGLETGGRYQTDSQKVTLIPSDEGGMLNGLTVTLLDRDGQDLGTLFDMKGEEFYAYLEENDGVVTFNIPEGFENQVRIVCTDCAVHSDGSTNTYDESFTRITVSPNQFVIFFADRTAFGLSVAGIVAAIVAFIALILRKKSKKEEKSKV